MKQSERPYVWLQLEHRLHDVLRHESKPLSDGLLLNKATWRTYTPFTATAISGPAMLAIDNLDPPWYATVSGSKMHVGYLNGTMLIFR